MAIEIFIPTPLRPFIQGKDRLEIEASEKTASIAHLFQHLSEENPSLKKYIFNEEGKLRNFINIYLNEEDIRYKQGEETALKDGDSISIIPSIAGGTSTLSPNELRRYDRHIILPEVGLEGQEKLKNSSVLLIGAGGLGSPLALYLAAAGIGKIGIVDFDVVDESNLQRQILHGKSFISRPKLESAAARLNDLNEHVEVVCHNEALSSENALELFKDYDLIADGTDNFPTRYLVNDACVLLNKPNVYGSIFRFEGQVSVFHYQDGPCYRCLYSEPPPPGLVPSCAEGGVFGVLPGVVGCLQATEVIKVLLGIGEVLSEKLLIFDALRMHFRTVTLRKNENCVVCGKNPTVTELIDYQQFCGIPSQDTEVKQDEQSISAEELKKRIEKDRNFTLLDVREHYEAEISQIEDSVIIPLPEIEIRYSELDPKQEIIVYCKSGMRSATALDILKQKGFHNIKNLRGGINEYANTVDHSLTTY